ncbi:MAG TPA: TonB-dependent receptor [Steroidobacteraceae bacterium]|nr:TonB-dependent receptor [Steroidobacteraceae bacterium]
MAHRLSIITAVHVALGAGLLASGQAHSAEGVGDSAVAAGEEVVTLATVIVTARNREESAQDIPIPVTVLDAEKLETFGIQTVWDLEFYTPNIELNPPGENARKVSAKIRGLGVAGANDSAEKSVSTIVDGVSLYYSGQAWANYVDVDRIEVLSGPQGTLQGKNSSLGAIRIITKAPSFNKEATYEISSGDLNTLNGKFSATGPLIDGKLAYRGTFSGTRGDGIYTNTYQSFGKSKETWREQSQFAGRFQLLWTPTDDLRGRFIVDKMRSDERVNTGNVLTSNGPANYAWGTPRPTFTPIGYTPSGTYVNYGLLGKWAERSAWFHNDDGSVYAPKFNTTDIENSEARPQVTNQWGGSAQFDWNVLHHTVTYLGAYRYQDFDIKNGGQNGRWYIGNSGQQLFNNQTSHELRVASTPDEDSKLDYQAGLYYLGARVYSDDPSYYGPDAGAWNASTAQYTDLIGSGLGRELLEQSQNGVYRSQVTDAEVWSRAAFGQVDWHITSRAKLTAGYRLTHETKKNRIRKELDRGVANGADLVTIYNRLAATNVAINGNGSAVSGGNARLLADALALRASAIGGGTVSGSGGTAAVTPTALFDWQYGAPITGDLSAWTLSPSYEISKTVSVYASVAQGAKSGYINFSSAGVGMQIKPEKSRDYEVGIKSLLLNGRWLLNANLYKTTVKDYQASWRRPNPLDPDNRGQDISGVGNVESIGAKGFEFQTAFEVLHGLTLNANASYNIAKYETDWLVALPPQTDAELITPLYINAKGQQLASVPKIGFAYGASYRRQIGDFLATVSLANRYVGHKYSQDYHTEDTFRKSYTLTNLVLGFGGDDGGWQLSVRANNLLDTKYGSYSTWGATSAATATPGAPRNFQIVFSSRL